MSLSAEKSFKMKLRDVETAFKYRRFPYPKRSVELIALLAISCTFFLFMHTNKLNSRLKEMEMKLQPSEFSALGLTGSNHLDSPKHEDINTLHGTYQYLKSTGQLHDLTPDKLNNTAKAVIDILVFNRVPKVGSQTMMALLRLCATRNGFRATRDTPGNSETIMLTPQFELDLIEEILEKKEPASYSKHVAYIDFSDLDNPEPIYMNLVRDPVERIISWFYYVRAPWYIAERKKMFPKEYKLPTVPFLKKDFSNCVLKNDPECVYSQNDMQHLGDHRRQLLFFCGQETETCMPFNSYQAMQRAKQHVETKYAVVGTWEDTNVTLTVLENYIPRFFAGAADEYYKAENRLHKTNRNSFKPPVSPERHPRNTRGHLRLDTNDEETDLHHVHHKKKHNLHHHEHNKSNQQHKDHTEDVEDDLFNDDEEEEEDDDVDEYEDSKNLEADALNNTKKAEVDVIVFNRVPKVGSQAMMELMIRLGKINNFQHSRDVGKAHETIFLKPPQQKELIADIYAKPRPRIYSQHIAYVNFTRFHMPKPIYINLVRDPIERIISWHYYVRAEWYYKDMADKLGDKAPKRPADEFMKMDLDTCVQTKDIHCQFNQMEIKNLGGDHRRQTLFFCGQNKQLCMPFNSEAAMQKAKRTVEEDYAVVGTWEDTNITLSVLEHYIPRFFRNAKVAYYLGKDRLSQVNKNKEKRPVSDVTREILRKNLTREIEFYEFCKQRLYLQYAVINDGLQIDNDDYILIPDQDENENDDY